MYVNTKMCWRPIEKWDIKCLARASPTDCSQNKPISINTTDIFFQRKEQKTLRSLVNTRNSLFLNWYYQRLTVSPFSVQKILVRPA